MRLLLILCLTSILTGCQPSKKQAMKTDNPLLCDPKEGLCELPTTKDAHAETAENIVTEKTKIVYFTDPICSSCWGIEPQLRKLKLAYGSHIDIEYRMGGLLPNWSYNSGGISKPADVAEHWDEVSVYYDMPIDGDLWLEDPLHSSYPPSIAFKAAELQSKEKALLFLREIREMVFLKKQNIAKWEHLETAAIEVGLNPLQLKADFNGQAQKLFEEDLKIARAYGVRGFPTMYFVDQSGNHEIVYGARPFEQYQEALLKINPALEQTAYKKDWAALFSKHQSLTAKEFSVLSETDRIASENMLDKLTSEGKLEKLSTKNGALWQLK